MTNEDLYAAARFTRPTSHEPRRRRTDAPPEEPQDGAGTVIWLGIVVLLYGLIWWLL